MRRLLGLAVLFLANPVSGQSFSQSKLDCKIKYFEKGTDTGIWSDGILFDIGTRIVTIYGAVLKKGRAISSYEINSVNDKSISFDSGDGVYNGEINRINGSVMITKENNVIITGICKQYKPVM